MRHLLHNAYEAAFDEYYFHVAEKVRKYDTIGVNAGAGMNTTTTEVI